MCVSVNIYIYIYIYIYYIYIYIYMYTNPTVSRQKTNRWSTIVAHMVISAVD